MSPDDILVWPDGEWCYREELEDMGRSRSDDYVALPDGSVEWLAHVKQAIHDLSSNV